MKSRATPDVGADRAGPLEVVHDVEVGIHVAQASARPEQDSRLQVKAGAGLLEFEMTTDRERSAGSLGIHLAGANTDRGEIERGGGRGHERKGQEGESQACRYGG